MSTPKRWADEYSSDEGSVDPDDEPEEKPQPSANASKALAPEKAAHQSSYNVVAPGAASLIAYVTVGVSTTTRSDIGHFFEMKGCSIRNLDFHISHDGRHCTAIIEFKDDESFQICLRANGEPYQGSSIRTKVFEVRDKARGPQGNIQGGRGAPRGGDDRFAGRRNGPPSQDPRADVRGDARGDSRGGGVGGGRGAGYGRTAERVDSSRGPAPYAKDATVVPTAPPSRPKLVLQPRTLPVEIIGKIVADETKPDIFGGGRPHDELLYEVLPSFQPSTCNCIAYCLCVAIILNCRKREKKLLRPAQRRQLRARLRHYRNHYLDPHLH